MTRPAYLRHLTSPYVPARAVIAALLAIPLSVTPTMAAAVCSIDPQDFDPAIDVTRSQDLEDLFTTAKTSILRRDVNGNPDPNGLICIMNLGMSTGDNVGQALRTQTRNDWKTSLAPGVKYFNVAQSGKTVRFWGLGEPIWGAPPDASHPNGTGVWKLVKGAGCAWPQVQVVNAVLAQDNPAVEGVMVDADVISVVDALHFWGPHVAVVQATDHPFTGYVDPSGPWANKVPDWSVYAEGVLMRDLAESQTISPLATFLKFYSLRARGHEDRGDGLTWACSDVDQGDGHHPIVGAQPASGTPWGTGSQKLANFILGDWLASLPEVVPGPPAPKPPKKPKVK